MNHGPEPQGRIAAAPCPTCKLCGSPGETLYESQTDRLFGAEGVWHLKRCPNVECRLIWLDPMPRAEEIGKAYAHYYTHAAPGAGTTSQTSRAPVQGLRLLYRRLKQGYLQERYGYPMGLTPWMARCGAAGFRLLPFRRAQVDGEVRGLRAVPNGRLLDLGCGSGQWLGAMRQLGWQVEGVDFDENAVQAGCRAGLALRCGSLEEQAFPDGVFDVITMSNVIEHLPDPVGTLKECHRLLRKGGRLLNITPNGASLGHRWFSQDWRGLEPPRHLHIFSPPALRRALTMAGFRQNYFRFPIATFILYESLLLRRRAWARHLVGTRHQQPTWMLAWLLSRVEWLVVRFNPELGDFMHSVSERT